MIDEFLYDLNRAIPKWGIDRSKIIRVTAGVLPAIRLGKADMAHRSTFVKHEIDGLFSVCGIKYAPLSVSLGEPSSVFSVLRNH
jgi:hypothetical protein